MEPIRVLQVLASLDRGGAETMIMNIYQKIDRTKIQFDFVVNEREDEYAYEAEIKQLGGRIFQVPRFIIVNYFSYIHFWKRLLFKHPEWLIIHGHYTSSGFIYLKVAKALNRVTIAHSHTAGGENNFKSSMLVLLRFPLRYMADHLFACSSIAAKSMFGKYYKSTYIINNAIDIKKFNCNEAIRKEKRKEFKIEDRFVMGHVGRFHSSKNHNFLIDIFHAVHTKNKTAVLMLVGDGILQKSVEKKIKELNLEKSVIFTGARSDIPELLQAMDVFVFPSLYEGLGIVVIEAQATGMHCIVATTIPKEAYVTDLIEGVSLNASINIWVTKILKYADGYERGNTYLQIKSKGYDIFEMTDWFENFYLKICNCDMKFTV